MKCIFTLRRKPPSGHRLLEHKPRIDDQVACLAFESRFGYPNPNAWCKNYCCMCLKKKISVYQVSFDTEAPPISNTWFLEIWTAACLMMATGMSGPMIHWSLTKNSVFSWAEPPSTRITKPCDLSKPRTKHNHPTSGTTSDKESAIVEHQDKAKFVTIQGWWQICPACTAQGCMFKHSTHLASGRHTQKTLSPKCVRLFHYVRRCNRLR